MTFLTPLYNTFYDILDPPLHDIPDALFMTALTTSSGHGLKPPHDTL